MTGKKEKGLMALLSRYMMSCDEASFLISRSQEERLTLKNRVRLKMHTLTCHLCRKYEQQIRQLSRMMKQYRHTCEHDSCMHRLPGDRKKQINQDVNRTLKRES